MEMTRTTLQSSITPPGSNNGSLVTTVPDTASIPPMPFPLTAQAMFMSQEGVPVWELITTMPRSNMTLQAERYGLPVTTDLEMVTTRPGRLALTIQAMFM